MEELTMGPLELEGDLEEDNLRRFLVFGLDGKEFAVGIRYVVDIINIQPITPIPSCPDYVRGVTNLRGRVIPIVDMHLRFGNPLPEYNDRTCIVVVEVGKSTVGLVVDSVLEVLAFRPEDISPPPGFQAGSHGRFVQGIGQGVGGVKLILDPHRILDDEEGDDEL